MGGWGIAVCMGDAAIKFNLKYYNRKLTIPVLFTATFNLIIVVYADAELWEIRKTPG
ncbi:hypothetical protein AAE02nite_35970 [Adhaeribacter aerolatus]|uniref:Uncharacterized protein n=1 Tax=Adhaeribacter aerolatus TaxID=670289 RepID=A0A512B1V4_9BACT|nr:hypothetical protein AAE02nite_35970 [Adhaeribacter aerolatus]